MMLVVAIAGSIASHAIAAGMTVVGLGTLGFASAALALDHNGLSVHESFGPTVKRRAGTGAAVTAVALIVAGLTAAAHGRSTPYFVTAFAAAVLTGAITIGAATR